LARGSRAEEPSAHTLNCSPFYFSNYGPPSTINVYRVALGRIDTVEFKAYVKNVLPNEWISSWEPAALQAGALAVKTYAWHWVNYEKYPGQCYSVRDDSLDQVYIPGSEQVRTSAAVDNTWRTVMTQNNTIFEAHHAQGDGNACGQGSAGGTSLSQYGSQACALNGDSAATILSLRYYFASPLRLRPIGFNHRLYRKRGCSHRQAMMAELCTRFGMVRHGAAGQKVSGGSVVPVRQ
jgi:peptidoglycan hydrolase-like amidase